MAAGERCGNCKFGHARTNEQGQVVVYICRRRPPTVHAQFFPIARAEGESGAMQLQDFNNAYWPPVRADDWCGEHSPDIQVVPGSRLKS
jgi:hypothetical protein